MVQKNRTTTTQPIDWNEAERLLSQLKYDKDHYNLLLFSFGFNFGLRIGDILNIKWEQLDQDTISLNEQKTGKRRTITINDTVRENIEFAKRSFAPRLRKGYVFRYYRAKAPNKPITIQAVNKRIAATFKKYGIYTDNPSSHTLRKTFAKEVYISNGKSEDALILLSELFNHKDIATTRKYIGITKEMIGNVYLNLGNRAA